MGGLQYYDLQAGTAPVFWVRFVMAVLATWRVSHLVVSEDGPWDILTRLRRRLGHSFVGRLMDCFGCVSIWVAALMSLFVFRPSQEGLVCWLALSGAAFLLERMQPEPVVLERICDEPGKDNTSWDVVAKHEPI